MATIRYTTTYFNEPGSINEDSYNQLKRELLRNPNFEIDPNPETFSQHFSSALRVIKICGIAVIVGAFIALALSSKPGDWADSLGATAAGIGSFIIIFAGIHLLLEGPSYATYVKKKTEYFSRMKYAIQATNSYSEFSKSFYGR